MAGKCAAYWRAKKLGKECGVPTSKWSLINQGRYEDFIDELVGLGVDRNEAFDHIPFSLLTVSSGRDYIVFTDLRRDSPIRKKMVDYIFKTVCDGKKVTHLGLHTSSGINKSEMTLDDFKNHYREERINNPHHNCLKARGFTTTPNSQSAVIPNIRSQSILLLNLCTSGQIGILQAMDAAGYGDDEYAAFCIAIKWAAERLEAEKAAKSTE